MVDLANTTLATDMPSLLVLHCLDSVLETAAPTAIIPITTPSPSSLLGPDLVLPLHDSEFHNQGVDLVFTSRARSISKLQGSLNSKL